MTDSEWLAATEPRMMLEWLRNNGRLSERKARLFGVACCRYAWQLFTDERLYKVVEVAEHYADGGVEERQLTAATETALAFRQTVTTAIATAAAADDATFGELDDLCLASDLAFGVQAGDPRAALTASPFPLLWEFQAVLLRCLFGNPFHPPPHIPPSVLAWNDATVVKIAQRAYDERDWSLLPILADALEDAGSSGQSILGHLRGPGPHARGCHVIDLVLGKS